MNYVGGKAALHFMLYMPMTGPFAAFFGSIWRSEENQI
jgi:hypothetical protein